MSHLGKSQKRLQSFLGDSRQWHIVSGNTYRGITTHFWVFSEVAPGCCDDGSYVLTPSPTGCLAIIGCQAILPTHE